MALETKSNLGSFSKVYIPGGIFILSLALNLFFIRYGINLSDEGFIVYGAERVMEGKLPYLDFFTIYAPGHFYPLGVFMKLFGFNLISSRLFFALLEGVLAVLIFLISRRLLKHPLFSALSALIFIFLVQPWLETNADRLLLPFLSLYLLLEYHFRRPAFNSFGWPLTIGTLNGLSILVSQEVGIYLFLALVAFFAWQFFTPLEIPFLTGFTQREKRGKNLLQTFFLSLGAITVIAPVIFYFYFQDALKEMVQALIWFPFQVFSEKMASPFPSWWPVLTSIFATPSWESFYNLVSTTLFYLPPLVYLTTAILLFWPRPKQKRNYQKDSAIFLILIFGVLLFRTTLVRSDLWHLMFSLIPAVILSIFLLDQAYARVSGRGVRQGFRILFSIFTCIIILILAGYGQKDHLLILKNRDIYGDLGQKRAPVKIEKAKIGEIGGVVSFIEKNTSPSDKIFVLPYEAMFYFLTNRDDPTRYSQILPGDVNRKDQREIVQTLERTKPKFIIYVPEGRVDGSFFKNYASIVDKYIHQKFRPIKRFGMFAVLKERE